MSPSSSKALVQLLFLYGCLPSCRMFLASRTWGIFGTVWVLAGGGQLGSDPLRCTQLRMEGGHIQAESLGCVSGGAGSRHQQMTVSRTTTTPIESRSRAEATARSKTQVGQQLCGAANLPGRLFRVEKATDLPPSACPVRYRFASSIRGRGKWGSFGGGECVTQVGGWPYLMAGWQVGARNCEDGVE
ncbi:hypothetical protein FA13DRAFT_1717382 [Coprinellus micaceus]|uniref:Uncharacterized protein n=1 Tax=Coprinellus micaceus TaxID=71717 RepID=A0A4Y7SGL6_COPMI|nr:hypothetical protein FA13DRAFT_1717382 [Coprinellus micaceus]